MKENIDEKNNSEMLRLLDYYGYLVYYGHYMSWLQKHIEEISKDARGGLGLINGCRQKNETEYADSIQKATNEMSEQIKNWK